MFDYARLNELWFGRADEDPAAYGLRRIRAEHPEHPYAGDWWPIGQGVGYGSTFANQARQHSAQPEPLVVLNPLDAAGRGVNDGDQVKVFNDRGSFACSARVSDDARPGVVVAPMGWWNADYPDPENFLFLLDGAQSRALHHGENAANYDNPRFDALFERMRDMPNSPERQKIIDAMVGIARNDAPWIWGFFPKDYLLYHGWLSNVKPNDMARNDIKYLRLDPARRAALRREWNRPVVCPLALGFALLVALALPAFLGYRRRERMAARPSD